MAGSFTMHPEERREVRTVSNHREKIDPVVSRLAAKLKRLGLDVGESQPNLATLEMQIDRLLLQRVPADPTPAREAKPEPEPEAAEADDGPAKHRGKQS